MAEKSKTVHVIELNANAKHLSEALAALKKNFSGMVIPPELEKTFTKLESSISSIIRRTEKGIIPREDFVDTEREINKVKAAFDGLSGSIEGIKKSSDKKLLAMLPEDTVAKLEKAKNAYNAYAQTLATVTSAERALQNALEKKAAAEEKSTGALASERAYKGKVTLAEKELDKYAAITAALKEQAEATKELEDAQKRLAEARSTGKSEKTIASRQAVVDKATERKASADTTVAGFSKKDMSAQEAAVKKVAVATEKHTAAKKASEAASKSLTEAEVAAQTAKTNLVRAQNKSAEEAQKEAQALAALRAALEAVDPKYKNMAIEGKTAGEQLEFLRQKVENLSEDELVKLKTQLEKADGGFDNFKDGLEDTKGALQRTKQAIKETDEAIAQQEAFENKIKQFLGLSGAAQLLRSALRDAMQTITELDATMTEMAVVTDLTVGDYWEQLPEYSKQASDLGVSINSAYKAATLYYQQGLKGNEVTKISAETLKMAKVAGLDAADATNKMTAALRGFNMELNETSAQKVADVYAELAAITAADVGEISNAMTKTASIAHSAGMEFETTAAFLSQIIETTRESAETAGTAMKTIVARFQELKKDPAEIGEVDGEIVDANKIETALRSVGVSLRDSSGQFRELDEVFLELSSKWGSLDKNTQRYIATIAAGSRQQSRFIAMMSDYGRTQELVTAANNSAGASQRQFEKTTESLEYKVERLKNAWHEFTMGIMESDLIKFGVDILTKFLEIVNKVTEGINGFGGGLTKIMSVLTIFKLGSKIFEKIKQPLIGFFADIVKMAREEGQKSGEAFKDGVEASKNKSAETDTSTQPKLPTGYSQDAQGQIHNEKGQFISKEEEQWLRFDERLAAPVQSEGKLGQNKFVQGAMKFAGLDKFAEAEVAHKMVKESKAKLGGSKAERKANAEKYQAEKKELGELQGKKKKSADDEKKIKKLTKSTEDYETAQENLSKASKKQWQAISDGISSASSALMGIGMGLGMVGSAFESLGMEEVAEGFNKASQIFSTTGAILGIIPPILTLIQTLFPGVGASSAAAGATATTAGTTASAAWSIVGVIVLIVIAAIVVALAVILLIMAAVHNASPEKKLEDTKKAAEQASAAADDAAESYEKLAQALDDLKNKYAALEELTKGTKEWNEAVQDINSSVMDLMEQYPELSKFVQNEGGVLTLDTESDDVQAVLEQARARKNITKNTSIMTNVAVSEAQNDVDYENLDIEIDSREMTDELAKKMASGELAKDEDIEKYLEDKGYDNDDIEDWMEEIGESSDSLRSYGESLNNTSMQQQAAYNAIAASAQGLANTLDMTADQIQQSSVVVDGDISGQYYEEMMDKIGDEDFTGKDLNDYNGEYKTLMENAIKQQYGSTAKLGEDGTVSYEKDGKTVEIELDNDQIKRMIATQYATEQTATAIEFSDEAITKIAATSGASDAINAMYMANEGKALTQQNLKSLEGVTDFQAIWDSMTENERKVYGDDINKLKKDFSDAITFATDAFDKAGDAARDFMTADMAVGFKKKLDEVASLAGGAGAKADVQKATDTLLGIGNKTDDEKQAIQSRINMTDWSSVEDLLALQIDLEQQYGYTEEQAKTYINALGTAAYATSKFSTAVKTFGDFWKATEKINQSMQRLTNLQWEYNRALEKGEGDISDLVNSMLSEYSIQATEYKNSYDAATDNLAKTIAQGGTEYGTDLTKFVQFGENGVEVDSSRLQDAVDSGKVSQDDVDAWLEKVNEQYANQQDSLSGLQNTLDNIEVLEQEGQDAYYELRDMAKEAILSSLQKQIDLQQQTLDATQNANTALINKIQEQINDNRQARQNEEAEKNLTDLRNQQAFLGMDTSGANALQMQTLDQSLADAEQSYSDSLVDQSLQSLQDANDKAAEQRERQISLAESQLEAYQNSMEFQQETDFQLNEMIAAGNDWQETQLGSLITEHFAEGLSTEEAAEWATDIGTQVELANTWNTTDWITHKEAIEGSIGTINAALTALPDKIAESAETYKLKGKREKLAAAGFDKNSLESIKDEEQLNKLLTYTENEDAGKSTASSQEKLDTAKKSFGGLSYQSKADYYKANMASIAAGNNVESYESYLKGQVESGKTQIANSLAGIINNNRNGVSAIKDSEQFKNALAAYKALGGSEDNFKTKLSDMITGGSVDGVSVDGLNSNGGFAGDWDHITATLDGTDYELQVSHFKEGGTYAADSTTASVLSQIVGGSPSDGYMALYNSLPYIYVGGNRNNWFRVSTGNREGEDEGASFVAAYKKKLAAYEQGGLADFTGPAWLDGTKSRPEYILNAKQTERFFSLIDVLEKYEDSGEAKQTGNNYFEIDINVEKLENDYDVEKLAEKIRKLIYEDATYRNVNAISYLR